MATYTGETSIDFDHEKILGNTINEIAHEKAGIIKKKTPLITTKQPKEILPWIYCVTTIIAPPHPGIAPKKEAIGTCIILVLDKNILILKFVSESKPIKTIRVNPTKTDTCK